MGGSAAAQKPLAFAKQLWVACRGATSEKLFRKLFEDQLGMSGVSLKQDLFKGMVAQ